MSKPKFSVIIPTREINDYIREAMPYYEKQEFKDFEIIIVTESISDEIIPAKQIKVGRVPPSEKRNIGVKNAQGSIIAFIDDDAFPREDWLKNAIQTFEDKNIVAIGGPGLVPKNASFFQRVSNKVYELSSGKTGIRYGLGKRKEIDDWPTCNFFVRKKEFLQTKGFDSHYWGGEDTQICYSLLKTGKKIIYDPEVIVYHHPRKNLKQHLKQTYFWGMWRGFFMKIHPKNSIQLVFFIPAAFLIFLVAGGIISLFSKSFALIYYIGLLLYLLFLLITGVRTKDVTLFIPVIMITFLTQISYGLGFLKGLLFGEPTRKTFNPAEKINLTK